MEYAVALIAGLVAGTVNTLAFSGSFLTLPALLLLGLPVHVANGTNRVGVLLAALVSAATFRAGGRLPREGIARLVAPSCLGALLGAVAASWLPAPALDGALAAVMLGMLVLLLVRPRWLLRAAGATPRRRGTAGTVLVFAAVGFYGGFLQAGVGLFLLVALIGHAGLALTEANGMKNLLVLLFTVPALAIFAWRDQVDWGIGLLMATGQCVGAFLAARFAVRHARAEEWTRRLLIVVLALTALDLLGLVPASGALTGR